MQTKITERPIVDLNHHLTYLFTSGTTGLPKGVIGIHEAPIVQVSSMDVHY